MHGKISGLQENSTKIKIDGVKISQLKNKGPRRSIEKQNT